MSTQMLIFKYADFLFLKKMVDNKNNNNCCQIVHFLIKTDWFGHMNLKIVVF